ncbi:PEP-CTERM sorting domain-containing protein [Botrimarina hoheduenensis]|uniref:Ice-binding protein C-terminal domain-containing protein n=1 Tax=Botrimarina hoheduenensis TaxID=2528000 RepID=A0A5C5VSE3_9BACT|nr:PEP-CTERM sorting domain-containing protein [Botrimarina hoheduenensis]TWT41544.1 hypothetical protein Pla111_29210 [Botrimarina hoheduenensis]
MRCATWIAAAAAFCLIGGEAHATNVEIQLVDVDIEYNANTGVISNAGLVNDDLAGIYFFSDGAQVGSLLSPAASLAINLSIPGVFGIDPNGDSVVSAAGGTLELLIPDSILKLTLQAAEIIYSPTVIGQELFRFSFIGTVGDIVSQALPFGLQIGNPVAVTLSTRARSISTSQTRVESFEASGSGELNAEFSTDPNNNIPEPGSIALLATIGLLAGGRRRR